MSVKTHRPAALITGGARRIGRAVVLGLAADGFDIAIHCHRSRREADKVADLVRKMGGACAVFQSSLTNDKTPAHLIARVHKRFPNLRVLVNSASVFKSSGMGVKDVGLLQEHWMIHVQAPWVLTAEFARLAGRGVVINFLDTAITKNFSPFGGYLLSKKAMADLTKMQALKFAPNVRVNAVAPGFILPPEGQSKEFVKERLAAVPLKQQGSLPQVVQATRFLIQNEYVTGQTIFVDGGEHLI